MELSLIVQIAESRDPWKRAYAIFKLLDLSRCRTSKGRDLQESERGGRTTGREVGDGQVAQIHPAPRSPETQR